MRVKHDRIIIPDPTTHQSTKTFANNEPNQLRQQQKQQFIFVLLSSEGECCSKTAIPLPNQMTSDDSTNDCYFPHWRRFSVRPIFPWLCMWSTFAHTNIPGVPVPPPPPLMLAPPRLSAVAWGGCFHVSLAESSSCCLQTRPPHLTLTVFYPSARPLLLF